MSVSQLLIFARVFKSPLRIDNKIYVVLRSLDPFAEFHLSNCCLGFISYVLLLRQIVTVFQRKILGIFSSFLQKEIKRIFVNIFNRNKVEKKVKKYCNLVEITKRRKHLYIFSLHL